MPTVSQANIVDVAARRVDADLRVSWVSTDPPGTWFQVYVGRQLAWFGTARSCTVRFPGGSVPVAIDVQSVDAASAHLDLAASLPPVAGGGMRIQLSWLGGTFQGLTIAGFNVYYALDPIDPLTTDAAAFVAAYPQDVALDGYGMGGYGKGGYGRAASSYAWTSDPVPPGDYNVAVVAVDAAGNTGTAATDTVSVSGPPRPPAADSAGRRLAATVNRTSPTGYGTGGYGAGGYGGGGDPYVTLSWLASPAY